MRTYKWILLAAGLIVPAIIFINPFNLDHKVQAAFAQPPPHMQKRLPEGPAHLSRAPRYVSVQFNEPLETLVAGESGYFELEAELKAPEGSSETPPQWDLKAEAPLVIWIATPDKSGIEFIDKSHPDRPRHHILVKFAPGPEFDGTSPLLGDGPSARTVLTVEMSAGQMWEDVRLAVAERADTPFFGEMGGIVPTPRSILNEVKKYAR